MLANSITPFLRDDSTIVYTQGSQYGSSFGLFGLIKGTRVKQNSRHSNSKVIGMAIHPHGREGV